ncbi:AEC family transporter [Serpentinicella alkaliphila]
MGFPILNAVYGSEGILYGSIFQIFYTIFIWTYGVILFKNKVEEQVSNKDIKKAILEVVLNPNIIAVYIGIIIMAVDIRLPNMLLLSVNAIGSITGPLSMIIVGVILSEVDIKNYIKDITVYYGVIVKLIVMPLILYFLLLLISNISIINNTLVILVAMPSAIMTSIFAESYKKEKDYATVIVFLTTVFSIVTLPLLLKLIV